MSYEVPLSEWDLAEIRKMLLKARQVFGEDPEFTKFGENFTQIRLDVARPGSDEPVGYITYHDGWLGFVPVTTDE